jgi:hypothetical protein
MLNCCSVREVQEVFGNDGLCATRAEELRDGGQQVDE